MAEIQYGEVGVGSPSVSAANIKWAINWLGGLVSVTLIAGLVFWGYQLMMRDVTGVPVVRALEGPMRITPIDPGGTNAQHQGLAVNNIPAVGEAEAPADRLVLAPKPTALGTSDPTAQELVALHSQESTAVQSLSGSLTTVLSDADETSATAPLDQASLIEATLRMVEGGSTRNAVEVLSIDPLGDVIAVNIPGVSNSLYPVLRPALLLAGLGAGAVQENTAANISSIDPETIPAGTRLAQLGAFETVDIAKAEWLKVTARFDEFMTDKARVIEQAQSGGKVFYRLRAHGFADLSDARRFCSTLLAAQANCIPVVTR